MKNFLHKKKCTTIVVQQHMEPPLTPLIIYFVKLKFCRDPTTEKSDLYVLKMTLFDNGGQEKFLLNVSNFNMAMKDLGTLELSTKAQDIHTLVGEEVLRQFDALSGV